MSLKLICNKNSPPFGGLAVAELIKGTIPVTVSWAEETAIIYPDGQKLVCFSNNDVLRALARVAPSYGLYGQDCPIIHTMVDQWLTFSLTCDVNPEETFAYLNKCLAPITYLVSNQLTIADFAIFHRVYKNYEAIKKKGIPNHVQRWYNLIIAKPCVRAVLDTVPAEYLLTPTQVNRGTTAFKFGDRKQEGKFVDLPGAEMGKVIVRFPPEASGYLHIGHAKAALLNQYYQQAFQGKLIMRFDDTNPAKENVHFEKVILEDLEMLEIKPDLFTHTSNYFDLMIDYCEQMLRNGKAYVDDTEPEQMKAEREKLIESANRSNSVERNFQMWQEMLKGSAAGKKCCVRAKIDMSSPNGCMRDPTIYRCKDEPHPRTGHKYKVYPTYDFACPIVDAIEDVTHTLRTMEYHDRDDQFYWFIEALNLRRPYIWEYSRLNMTNTVLSKRKLTWFVDQGLVEGWDDPRFPTVRGILRRGMTVEGLKQFIIAQGSSKSVVFMEWDKIWAFNKKVIDPIAPRFTALEGSDHVLVKVAGASIGNLTVPLHPKNGEVGTKTVTVGPEILIDSVDADTLTEGENATFINWGNIMINKIHRNGKQVTSIDGTLNLDNKDYKKTVKLTWLAKLPANDYPPMECVYLDHIISKPVLGKDEDFKNYIAKDSMRKVNMLADPELKKVKAGDIIQLQRRGFFKVDVAYAPRSKLTGVECPLVLFSIPDGHSKEAPTASGTKKGAPGSETPSKSANVDATKLNQQIVDQGNKVRQLKEAKAEKASVEKEVKQLLELKSQFKAATGSDWKPGVVVEAAVKANIGDAGDKGGPINEQIVKQGEVVRDLKAKKASKGDIDAQVKVLLKLKADYKAATGQEWKPQAAVPVVKSEAAPSGPAAGHHDSVHQKITDQGSVVRDLKAKKAPKGDIDVAVKVLLSLKEEFKTAAGFEWKPDYKPAGPSASVTTTCGSAHDQIHEKIVAQGNLVRDLKGKKATKPDIDAAVKELLSLKEEFKKASGFDWKPDYKPVAKEVPQATSGGSSTLDEIHGKITKQGNLVRDLKAKKAAKPDIDGAVKELLALKEEFKKAAGFDWKPDYQPTKVAAPTPNMATKDELTAKITEQGNTVRDLKANKGDKAAIDEAVKLLLALKVDYKTLTGEEFPVAARQTKPKAETKPKADAKPKPEPKAKTAATDASAVKKQTRLGLEASKEENLPDWYSQVITKGEMIEYYDVSGCYILRHWSFAIWKAIRTWFDAEITRMGVKECYFPIFVSRAALEKEKKHIADFAPEVAWVTKSGDSDLAEPIAVRPTSETAMYPAYAKWIQSYRDLPIRLNQWNNVVRWEFKHPQPFLRTREFLWQEGHTAFANEKDAVDEVYEILDLYAKVYTDLLAIPVIKGRKTEKEKFAGGDFTTTVEAYISASGRAIQGATSHHLGQNFSKMFDVAFEDPETQQKQFVYQNSWGITTRTIGVMIMVHGDNQGLVLPPEVAATQVVIVPCGITVSLADNEREALLTSCKDLERELSSVGIRCEFDNRDNYSPGWKFNHWELKGVPVRVEVGPKDLKAGQVLAVRRVDGEKMTIKRGDVKTAIPELLVTIQKAMYGKALADLEQHKKVTKSWTEFVKLLDDKNIIMAPFCGQIPCEDKIKAESQRDDAEAEAGAPSMGAKSLCIPFDQPAKIEASDKCVHPSCKEKPKYYTLFGRSY